MSSSDNVITLNNENSIKIIVQYIELAQQKGSYLLQEADLLKRAIDVVSGQSDHQIDLATSKNLLIQGVLKGQQKGAYTLSDAALLFQVVKFFESNDTQPVSVQNPSSTESNNHIADNDNSNDYNTNDNEDVEDLSDLSDPIPFKPKEI